MIVHGAVRKHQINHIIIHHIANRPSCIYTIYIAYKYEYIFI